MEPNENERLGNKMILASDQVRIWEHRVPPGEAGETHLHRRPYLSVVVRGQAGDTIDAEGNVIEHFDLAPGSVYWVAGEDLPQTHALRNTGDEEVLIITTEIL